MLSICYVILTYANTQYIHVYDQPVVNEFQFLAKVNGLCIDFNRGIEELFVIYITKTLIG